MSLKNKQSAKIIGIEWNFVSIFNEAIRCLPERVMIKRDYLWASELQMDAYSRYLRMWAHPMTNPPTDRSRRKFIMGHIIEWIISLILTMCGILKAKQMRGEVQLPGLLKVSGKLDFIAGGEIVDWEKAKEEIKKMQMLFAVAMDDMPPIIKHAVDKVLTRMQNMFSRVPIREYIIECKSVSGMIMQLIQKSNKPRSRHVMQPLHYLLANKEVTSAQLLYISKDDAIMEQFEVTRSKELCKLYHADVKTMTDYYNNSGRNYMKNLPPREKEIIFEDDSFTFQKNMNVQYSNYLTLGWNYRDYDHFEEIWGKKKAQWNRTFKRCVNKDNMTALNKAVITEVKILFPQWDMYVEKARKAGAFDKPETEDEE